MKYIFILLFLIVVNIEIAHGALQAITFDPSTGKVVNPTVPITFPGGVTASNLTQLALPIPANSYLFTPDGTNFYMTDNGQYWTNLPVIYNFQTNGFTGTVFHLGTNSVLSSSTFPGFTDINNVPTSGGNWGEMTIIATGNLTITNPVSWHTSDATNSRSITTGQSIGISIEILAGLRTNAAIVVFP